MNQKQFEEAIPNLVDLRNYLMKRGRLVMIIGSSENQRVYEFVKVSQVELGSFQIDEDDRHHYQELGCTAITVVKDQEQIAEDLDAAIASMRTERDKAQDKTEARAMPRSRFGGFFLQGGAPGLGRRK